MATNIERPGRAALVGAIVAALITLPGLGVGTLWDNSETAYGEVAREILLTHSWVVMHFNGAPYFIQPPLYFWMGAIFAKIFGVSSFALRLPAALATIALGGMTGYAVARQAGTRIGIYASVILSSCLMQAIIGRLAIMDALLDLTVALTIFWWFRGLETGRDRYFIYGWLAAGFGFLAKGLVAPAIALIVIVPFFLWNRRHEPTHAPSLRAWLLGLLAFLVVALPWPLALVREFAYAPLSQLIGQYTIGRYTGVIENQSGPLWYYLPVIILGFFPWIAFLPMATVYGIRELRAPSVASPQLGRLVRLAFTWAIVPLLFFSFARTKLPNYVALEFPALALLTALYFEAVVRRGGTRSAVLSASFVPITIGMLAIAIGAFAANNRLGAPVLHVMPGLLAMGIAIFVGSLITAILVARPGSVGFAPYALGIATLIAIDAMAIVVLPEAEAYKPIPRLAAIVNERRRDGDAVGIAGVSGANALLFYTRPEVKMLSSPTGGGDDPQEAICLAKRIWLIEPRDSNNSTFGRRRVLIAADNHAGLFLYDGPGCTR